jgi:hypothetical protein
VCGAVAYVVVSTWYKPLVLSPSTYNRLQITDYKIQNTKYKIQNTNKWPLAGKEGEGVGEGGQCLRVATESGGE